MIARNFNKSWKFYRAGDLSSIDVDLPHDAMIEEERIENLIAGDTSGYFPGGSYIYEKHFMLNSEESRGEIIISFDGVYQKATVYLNGHEIARQIQGYTNFQVNLTEWISEKENVLQVKVDNTQTPNSRWYTGSGIYRDVTLYTGNKIYIPPYGIKINTISCNPIILELRIKTAGIVDVRNREEKIQFKIVDSSENEVLFNVLQSGWEKQEYLAKIELKDAELWSEEHPAIYLLKAKLIVGEIQDFAQQSFGIRKLSWNPEKGMLINEVPVKLRGACIHHDNGILGAREYRDVAFRKIRILKECGYNAIRTAHNEPSDVLLEACDRLGMYVMAEFTDVWRATKNDYDYSLYFDECAEKDLMQMVNKCMVHPSVIIYSIGNEVYDTKSKDCSSTCKMLVNTIHRMDHTRPITMGFNVLGAMSKPKDKALPVPRCSKNEQVNPKRTGRASPLVSSKLMNTVTMFMPKMMERVTPEQLEKNQGGLLDILDFCGLNYGTHLFTLNYVNPKRMIVNTETFPSAIGRTWSDTVSHPWVVGDFMWTGWDYLGECGIGAVEYGKKPLRLNKPYPCVSSGIGSINLVGEIEAQGYYAKTVYGLMKYPYIAVHPVTRAGEKAKMSNWRGTDAVNSWGWGKLYGRKVMVEVYSKEPVVELFQNGISLGKKQTIFCKAEYGVTYMEGKLEAVSYHGEKETGRSFLETDDETEKLLLRTECEQLNKGQIAYVFAEITDSKGIRKVYKEREIRFEVSGNGKLLATGSGNPWTSYSYSGNITDTWYGSAAAVVQTGMTDEAIIVRAVTQDGLSDIVQIPIKGGRKS